MIIFTIIDKSDKDRRHQTSALFVFDTMPKYLVESLITDVVKSDIAELSRMCVHYLGPSVKTSPGPKLRRLTLGEHTINIPTSNLFSTLQHILDQL